MPGVKNAGSFAITLWVELSAALAVVGVFGPWVAVHGSSIPGTTAGNRGWLVLSAALIGAGVFWFRRWTRSAGAYAAVAGVVAVAASSYDRTHMADLLGDSKTVAAHVGAGWGLDLAFVGAVSLTIAGVAWLITVTDLPWAWIESAPDGGSTGPTAVDLAMLEDEPTS
jgi:hypothetical protein